MLVWLLSMALAAPTELVDALAARHPSASCAALVEAHGLDAMVELAEGATMPPWLPMRAAHCVGEHASEGEAAIARWLADPALPGLAAAAVDGLERAETLPETLAPAIDRRMAADPRFARIVHLERSRHPELRALSEARQAP